MPLPLTGPILKAYNNLPCIPPTEPLGDLLNTLAGGGGGGAQGAYFDQDRNIVDGPRTLKVPVSVGTYKVELTVEAQIQDGSEGNSILVGPAFEGGLILAPSNFIVSSLFSPVQGADKIQSGSYPAPNNAPAFAFMALSTVYLKIEGFVQVTTAGELGFSFTLNGAPTSATISAGSGLLVVPFTAAAAP